MASSQDIPSSMAFSLQDFQQLVSDAFDLSAEPPIHHPPNSTHPAPHTHHRLSLSFSPFATTPSSTPHSLDSDSEDDVDVPYSSHPHLPNSPNSIHGDARSSYSIRSSLSRPERGREPFAILKSLRARASALLRTSSPDLSTISPSVTPTPSSRPSTARPSVSSQRTQTFNPNYPAVSHDFPPRSIQPTPTSRPSSPFPPNSIDIHRALSRARAHSLPKSFLNLSQNDMDPPPPLPQPSNLDRLPSFFDDSAYHTGAQIPSYSRTRAPVSSSLPHIHIHTRLPPLRKSKSYARSLFSKPSSKSPNLQAPESSQALPGMSFGLAPSFQYDDYSIVSPRCPSPFTSPRTPPTPPSLDSDAYVPEYVYARRGSATSTATATSTCTMSSTKSSSTLAERISSAFTIPLALKSRSRSKLHLSIASSEHSSPSSTNSGSRSPATPITPLFPSNYAFPLNEAKASDPLCPLASVAGTRRASFDETLEEALAIGRVLTPEEDPFAKAEIEFGNETTPRPLAAGGYGLPSQNALLYMRRGSLPEQMCRASVREGWLHRSSSISPLCHTPTGDGAHANLSPVYSFRSSWSAHPVSTSTEASTSGASSPSRSSNGEYPPSAWSPNTMPLGCSRSLPPSSVVAAFPLPPSVVSSASIPPQKPLPSPRKPLPGIPSGSGIHMIQEDEPFVVHRSLSLPESDHTIESKSRNSIGLAHRLERGHPSSGTGLTSQITPCRMPASEASSRFSPSLQRPPSPFPLKKGFNDGAANSSHISPLTQQMTELDLSLRETSFAQSSLDSAYLGESSVTAVTSNSTLNSQLEEMEFRNGQQDSTFGSTSIYPEGGSNSVLLTGGPTTKMENSEDLASRAGSTLSSSPESVSLKARSSVDLQSALSSESEDDWDRKTTRSTAFFSARSSMFSSLSAIPGLDISEDESTHSPSTTTMDGAFGMDSLNLNTVQDL